MSAIVNAESAGLHVTVEDYGGYRVAEIRGVGNVQQSGGGLEIKKWYRCHIAIAHKMRLWSEQADIIGDGVKHLAAIAREWDAERAGKEWKA